MKAWNCQLIEAPQSGEERSFVGGTPRLPAGTEAPVCTLCGKKMTFFFQVAFPQGHPWAGTSLALFYCLDCFGHAYCIPELPAGPLKGARVSESFLESYQRNFRVLVFDTGEGVPWQGSPQRIPFHRLDMEAASRCFREAVFTLGGKPIWIMRKDETPACCGEDRPLVLLFQIKEDYKFPRLEGAAPQASPFAPGGLSPFPWYDLFARDRIYFWGTADSGEKKVYISVQSN